MITIYHPETKGKVDVPDRSLKIYERSGWKVWEEGDGAEAESGASTDPSAKDSGEAGPQTGRTSARKSTKEGDK